MAATSPNTFQRGKYTLEEQGRGKLDPYKARDIASLVRKPGKRRAKPAARFFRRWCKPLLLALP
jgi:hypothetical protein